VNSSNAAPPGAEEERFHTVVSSPIGALRVVATDSVVVGVYHQPHYPPPAVALLGRCIDPLSGGERRELRHTSAAPTDGAATRYDEVLTAATQELGEYFEGIRREFTLPTSPRGTPFQLRVWDALTQIPYGERWSYRRIASGLGNGAMGRAIGAAVRANPLSIVIPGHRVVSTSGAVLGYSAGTQAKTALLELEEASVRRNSPQDRNDTTSNGLI
jgi:methylated-DNA-[protein]-cysteine S-methyltransferase